ncbi:MAG: peptidylprolyl isomerase [Steroidobacteraceae bacterium]|nr:peptidylprolyl isomerase [Steroidobacteraceae bacterium]
MSLISKGLLLACLAVLGAWPLARAAELSSRGVLLDRVAAVVNDGIVLVSDLDRQQQLISDRLQQAGQQLPPANILRQQVLERLVMQEVQMQRADRLGLKVSDEMVNQALAEVATRNKIQFSDLPAALEAQGVDYRSYREEVRREMTLNALRQRDVYSRIYVSPREVEQCFAKRKASPGDAVEYNLGHILVAVPATATPEQAEERVARAQGVYERARRGEDFAQLAISYSDAGTALEGGALGWRKGDQLPSFAADAIPRLKPGEVTEPIRTPSGLHLFKLIEARGVTGSTLVSQVHARHILMETNAIEDDETVRQKLAQFRDRIEKGESFEALASVNSADPGSAAKGGDLGWVGPGTFVPAFEQQIDLLAENEISQPFKTQFGWHIVQLLGRRTYDATDDVIRNRCVAQLRESKADEETEIWMRRLRDEAFVEIRL